MSEMPSERELEDALRGAVVELTEVAPEEVRLDRPLRELGVDSLMALELVVRMEQRYGVRLSEDEIRSVRTLGDMVAVAGRKALR